MKTVLYGDILFLINFSMDYISLYLAFLLMGRRFSAFRGVLAASIGGLFGVLGTYFGLSGVASVGISFFVSFLMVCICVKGVCSFGCYVKYTVILWGIGALLAGGVTFICSLGGEASIPNFKNAGAAPLFVFALAAVLVKWVLKVVSFAPKARKCTVELSFFGENVSAFAMVDSGNLVTEPLSGLPVVFMKKSLFSGADDAFGDFLSGDVSSLGSLNSDIRRRLRAVSVSRVGQSKVLWGVVVDEMIVCCNGIKKPFRALLVLEDVEDYGGFDAIVPPSAIS